MLLTPTVVATEDVVVVVRIASPRLYLATLAFELAEQRLFQPGEAAGRVLVEGTRGEYVEKQRLATREATQEHGDGVSPRTQAQGVR
jgi:hypothetical protein